MKGIKLRKYNLGIIRDEGSNGDKEMAAAFYHAGFNIVDINMYDLINKKYHWRYYTELFLLEDLHIKIY